MPPADRSRILVEVCQNDHPRPAETESPSTPKFCKNCGAPWPTGATSCPACNPVTSPLVGEATAEGGPQSRARDDVARDVRSALLLYGLLLATSIGTFFLTKEDSDPFQHVLIFDFFTVLVVLLMAVGSRDVLRSAIPGGFRFDQVPLIVGAVTVSVALALLNVEVVSRLIDEPGPGLLEILGLTDQSSLVQLIVIAAFPAIFEEAAFRGMFLPYMANRIPAPHAVVVTAAAFATIHLTPVSFPFLFCMGLILGWLRLETGSLIPPIAAHFLHNTVIWAEATLS